MKKTTLALAALLAAAPAVAFAQAMTPGGDTPSDDGPSTAMRDKMEHIRSDARAGGLGALSADHRARVLAIVDRFNDGTIADRADAATQIDAVLSPAEAKDEVARAQQMRADLRAAFASSGGPSDGGRGGPGGGGPGGEPGGQPGGFGAAVGAGGGPSDGARRGRRVADPGRFLLQVAADPAKLHSGMGERPPQR